MAHALQHVHGRPPVAPVRRAARAVPHAGGAAGIEVGQYLNRGLSPSQSPP